MRTILWVFMLCFSQQLLAEEVWNYVGVIGKGDSAVAVLQNEKTKKKVFRKKGQRLTKNSYRVANIVKNKVVLSDGDREIVLSSIGSVTSTRKKTLATTSVESLNFIDKDHELEKQFKALLDAGEDLMNSGEYTVEQVNEMIAKEMAYFPGR